MYVRMSVHAHTKWAAKVLHYFDIRKFFCNFYAKTGIYNFF